MPYNSHHVNFCVQQDIFLIWHQINGWIAWYTLKHQS